MEFKNVEVMGFEGAFRGMRNPKNSWDKSDSKFGLCHLEQDTLWDDLEVGEQWFETLSEEEKKSNSPAPFVSWLNKNGILKKHNGCIEYAFIGPKDMRLAKTLIRGGSEHRKFMRQIIVSVDITAPLYWWKEFDTYKVGTVANSTSTMHTITNSPITLDCFETGDFLNIPYPLDAQRQELKYPIDEDIVQMAWIPYLEYLRQQFNATKDEKYWKELIRWLPEGWLQTRTVTMTYENLFAMCSSGQRRFHKLNEWSGKNDKELNNFISWARTLPYAQDLIFIDEEREANNT